MFSALTLASASSLFAQSSDRNCCLISSTPGALTSAQLGDTVAYDFSVDVGKCGGSAVEWTWETVTAGLSIPPAAGTSQANVYVRFDAPAQARWLARVRAFNPQSSVTTCTGLKVMDIDVTDAVAPQPDLTARFTSIPDRVPAGDSLTATAAAENTGQRPVVNNSSSRIFVDGQVRATQSCLGGIPVGGSCPISLTAALAPGVHAVQVCADVFDEIPEEDEGNNCQTRQVTVYERPDLVVRSITVDPDPSVIGRHPSVTLEYANEGAGVAEAGYTIWFDMEADIDQFISGERLGPGESATTSIGWIPQ
ncbi:MAG: CARDB domain-containing protein, partial [Acidobacteriota bacterium]